MSKLDARPAPRYPPRRVSPRLLARLAPALLALTLAASADDAEQSADVVGRIGASDDEGVTLDVAGSEVRVPYGEVRKALVQIEFNRKDKDAD